MSWDEFRDLLSGLSPDTALGRMVAIRAEDDKEILKQFTPEQRRIRSQWRNRTAKRKRAEDTADFLAQMQNVFRQMAGGENG